MAPLNQDLGNETPPLISSHLRHESVELSHTSVTSVYTQYQLLFTLHANIINILTKGSSSVTIRVKVTRVYFLFPK